jgi:hypothetical protein
MPRPPQTKLQLIQAIQRLKDVKVVLFDQGPPDRLSRALRLLKHKEITLIVIEEA